MKKIFIISSILLLVSWFYYYLNIKIRTDFGRNLNYFYQLAKTRDSTLTSDFNFMILGLDPRNDTLEKTEATDTIIFGHFNHQPASLSLFPLPRDLWSYDLKSKINQVYSQSKSTPNRFEYIATSYGKILNQPIDRSIIITTKNLTELVEIVDGVDVYLEKGFIDNKYPNPEYILHPNPQTPIYVTISFPPGLNHLDSSNITQFVRSRKNAETSSAGGTDLGRIQRQELLIDALINKLKQPSILLNYHTLAKLYNFWQYRIETNFSDSDLLTIFLKNRQNILNTTIQKNDITPYLYHPDTFINPQWVFLPLSNDYKKLQEYIKAKIN